nr:unnamed protein product [Callosobruchus chinensis]
MVERAKNRLAKLFRKYIYNGQEDVEEEEESDEEDGGFGSKSDLNLCIQDTFEPMQQKASLDWQVVALFDNYMVKETKREVAGHPIARKIQGEALDEFKQKRKEAEEQVGVLKRKFEDYLISTIKANAPIDSKEADVMLEEMCKTFTVKALSDLQEGQQQTNKQVDKAKLNIRQQLQVFATNPAGPKTKEEIESEEYVKQALTDFQEKVRRDLVSTKVATDQIANQTKELLQMPFTESKIVEPLMCPIQDFSVKACTDLKDANVRASSAVTAIKEKLKDSTSFEYLAAASGAGPSVKEFNKKAKEEFAKADTSMKEDVINVKENLERVVDFETPDEVTAAMDAFLSDFQNADKKIKNEVDQVKDKVEETGETVKKVFKK